MSMFSGDYSGKRHSHMHLGDYGGHQKKSRTDFDNYYNSRFTGADAGEEDDAEEDIEETETTEEEIDDTCGLEVGELDYDDVGGILSRCVTDVQEIKKLIHIIATETHPRRKQDVITYTQEWIQGISFRLLFCANCVG